MFDEVYRATFAFSERTWQMISWRAWYHFICGKIYFI